jgi:protoheme IX farnesyltransferase
LIKADVYSIPLSWTGILRARLNDYAQLTKLRLSFLVVFSAVAAFILVGNGQLLWADIFMLGLAGFMVTGASNTLNQVIEKSEDQLMARTKDRPLAAGRMNSTEALLLAGVLGTVGIAILGFRFNALSGLMGALALISYAFVYTPFKKISAVAVFFGAIPGAMPLLIGCSAATGSIGPLAIVLFAIQFFWQMPHFWAIAWLSRDDYARAGFDLLPGSGEKERLVALQNLPYLVLLILAGIFPYMMGVSGVASLVIISLCGAYFLYCGIKLVVDLKDKSARMLMFASFVYIPVTLLALIIDKV